MAEPTPSTTIHQDADSAFTSDSEVATEHVMTVNNLGTHGNSSEVDNNLAMAAESSLKLPEDNTRLEVIDSTDQVSLLCRICKEGKTGDEDPLISLGCSCPSNLRQAHRSCIKVYYGRRVNRGEHFCRLCRDVLRHHIYKLATGHSGDDTDVHEKTESKKIQPKQAGFKGIRIYPTPPLLSDHDVEKHPTPDELNARRVADQTLHRNKMLDRLETLLLIMLIVMGFVVVNVLCLQYVYG